MRIGFLISHLGIAGSVRRVVELSNRLQRRGHEVIIYTATGETCNWLTLEAPAEPLKNIGGDFDALIKLGGTELTPFFEAANARRKITYLLGIGPDTDGLIADMVRGIQKPQNRRIAETVAAIREGRTIANCTAISRWVEEISGLPCPTVPGGVDLDTFKPGPKQSFLVLGGGCKKGTDGTQDILDAKKIVIEAEPRAVFAFYFYLGLSQPELAALYGSADVYVDAHHGGGWNNAVVEAMACQTAVVCTDIMGNEDFAIDGETALVVPAGDVDRLAEAVLRLLKEGELRVRLARNGRRHVQQFTWDHATDCFEAAVCVSA
jgi:hypothetical protein